ncbi:MAG: U32 family peptidase [Bacteroidales bacterium]|nr:U32 family peptidase [Bacteroidales bacterium]
MKIIAGISTSNKPEEITEYVKTGVDEFFVGYVPEEWRDEYGWELSCNRRETPIFQYKNREDLANVVNYIHQNNCVVYLTVNAPEYNAHQTKLLVRILEDIRDIEFDGFIVSNVGIILELQRLGFNNEINISIGAGCNNIETLKFFHENFANIGRFILPRKLTMNEIEVIAKYASDNHVRLEAFGLAIPCIFNDEYCFTWHGKTSKAFCQSAMFDFRSAKPLLFDADWKNSIFNEPINSFYAKQFRILREINAKRKEYELQNPKLDIGEHEMDMFNVLVSMNKCGFCAFQKFKDWGIEAIKLPLRGLDFNSNINVIKLAKRIIDEQNATPDFCRSVLQSPHYCSNQNCYYDYPYPK